MNIIEPILAVAGGLFILAGVFVWQRFGTRVIRGERHVGVSHLIRTILILGATTFLGGVMFGLWLLIAEPDPIGPSNVLILILIAAAFAALMVFYVVSALAFNQPDYFRLWLDEPFAAIRERRSRQT